MPPGVGKEREQLRELVDSDAFAAARRTTINAHFTDPAYVRAIWRAVEDLGFDGGRVLEPGAGAGTFIGLAPAGAQMTGVELDPTTAAIASGALPAGGDSRRVICANAVPSGSFRSDGGERAVRRRAAA